MCERNLAAYCGFYQETTGLSGDMLYLLVCLSRFFCLQVLHRSTERTKI
jgi:hypothetical protein